jgi:hypothetical protein
MLNIDSECLGEESNESNDGGNGELHCFGFLVTEIAGLERIFV